MGFDEVIGGKLLLVVQCYFCLGCYMLIVCVDDLYGEVVWCECCDIEVLMVEFGQLVEVIGEFVDIFDDVNCIFEGGEVEICIVLLFGDLFLGYLCVEMQMIGMIDMVCFELDDKLFLIKRCLLFSVDFDFGELLMSQVLCVIVFDVNGKEIVLDLYLVNGSFWCFGVCFVELVLGKIDVLSVCVWVDVCVFEGKIFESFEFYCNDDCVVMFFEGFFMQLVDFVGLIGVLMVLCVIGCLIDGEMIEDVVLFNGVGVIDEVQVDFVELYIIVVKD